MKRQKTYGTAKAAKNIGISKSTLLRWIADRKTADVARDHRGWRVFTDEDLKRIKREVFGNGSEH